MPQRFKTLSLAAALLALNAYIVRELFTAEYIAQMGSIEATHIAIARYAMQNWRDLTWFPLWYGGIPYQNTYLPLLHLIVAAAAKLLGISPAHSYHAVTAAFYCLGPVTLFWLAWRLTASRGYSFAAGLAYSLFSPSVLLISSVRQDMGSLFHPRRFETLVRFGEGPHVASMTLLPVAILCLHNAIEKRRPLHYLLAAISMAAVALTNWLGAFALAAACLAYLLSRWPGCTWKIWAIAAALGVYAYAVVAPWIPPSLLSATAANEQHYDVRFPFPAQHLIYAGLMLVALVLIEWGLARWRLPEFLRFAVLFSFLMATVTLSAEWFHVILMPQAERYHLEMEMGLTLTAVFAVKPLLDWMGRGWRTVALVACLLLAIPQAKNYRRFAKYQDRPIDIRATLEYQAAQWFDGNMQGRRVYATGSVGFWLNAFNDTPQFRGGYDQGIGNHIIPAVIHQMGSGEGSFNREGEIGALWLKAYGVHAIMIGGPRSRDSYRDFHNPRKFEGLFREVWRDGDDVIWEVPWRSPSLAHVMRPSDLVAHEPESGIDVDPLRPYVAALDNPEFPAAQFAWRNRHQATMTADLRPDQVLSVQISYHPGWHASVDGQPRRAFRDHLGQLAVAPACDGPCRVEIAFDGGAEMYAARLISWSAMLGGLLWALLRRRTA